MRLFLEITVPLGASFDQILTSACELEYAGEVPCPLLPEALEQRWRPIDTAPVPAWNSPEGRRGYDVFKCLGQLDIRGGSQPPWITTVEAYYVAAPRSTQKRILRWRDGAGRQCFPKYWQPLPEPCSEDAGSKP